MHPNEAARRKAFRDKKVRSVVETFVRKGMSACRDRSRPIHSMDGRYLGRKTPSKLGDGTWYAVGWALMCDLLDDYRRLGFVGDDLNRPSLRAVFASTHRTFDSLDPRNHRSVDEDGFVWETPRSMRGSMASGISHWLTRGSTNIIGGNPGPSEDIARGPGFFAIARDAIEAPDSA